MFTQQPRIGAYLRYSSDNQRHDSIDDQRRNIINHLERLGIDYRNIVELADEAISGTLKIRPNFLKLIKMIENDEFDIVIVDDLSRLTRGNDLGILWDIMADHGCRLISVLDGTDSAREGDEMGALIKGIMNNYTNKIHGRRVRRGIAGRVLDKFGSAGDRPFGYGSRYCDPQAAMDCSGGGPKPKKELFINEAEAQHVREIFRLFTEKEWSISRIAKHLNEEKVPTGKRSRIKTEFGVRDNTVWTKAKVRRILGQRKYVGEWVWGENICKKTDTGKVIKRPADPKDIIRLDVPELAIISRDLCERTQERLEKLKDRWGGKEGQKKRGPKRHYTEEFPNDIISGLLFCGKCGRRMYYVPKDSKHQPYFRCPNATVRGAGENGVRCDQKEYARWDRVFEALSMYLKDHLNSVEGWLEGVILEVRSVCDAHNASAPDDIKRKKDQRKAITASIGNIMVEIERGGGKAAPGILLDRLQALEAEGKSVDGDLRRLNAMEKRSQTIASDDWIKAQLSDLAGVFEESKEETAKLFRIFFGKVYVHSIVAPGKKRGHSVISFTPNHKRLVIHVAQLGDVVDAEAADNVDMGEAEVSIELAGHDKLDKLIPTIDVMRQSGRTWKSICAELGLAESWTNMYYNKWKALTTSASTEAGVPVPDIDAGSQIASDAG